MFTICALSLESRLKSSLTKRLRLSSSSLSSSSTTPLSHLSLPGPPCLPLVGSLLDILWKGGLKRQHNIMLEYHKQYGDIFKMKLGHFESMQIGHPILLEELFRNESQFPQRLEIRPWKVYRDYRDKSYGLLTLEGEEWIAVRRPLQQQLLKPNQIGKCHVRLNKVIENLITQIDSCCDEGHHV